MKKSYVLAWVLGCFIFSQTQALPSPSISEAKALAAQSLGQPLYWSPFRMPYEVAQNSQATDAKFLQTLYKNNMVAREPIEEKVSREVNGVERTQLELRWRYNYRTPPKSFEEEGFYYGDGQVLSVKIHPSVETSRQLLAQLDVRWGVKNIQSWVKDPVFKQARTLRRSLESQTAPFEKTLYVQYQKGAWGLWQPGLE
ncbi:MAG: hypothetical protein RL217_1797 [Pseudomonadota bacterium]|jgi:hypothetical protein